MSALGQEQATELARITRSGSLAINIRCYPPRLVFGEQLRRRAPARLTLKIDKQAAGRQRPER